MPANLFSESQEERLTEVATILREAERPVRILRGIAWPPEAETEFFAGGCSKPPTVHYSVIDPRHTLDGVAAARALIDGDTPVHDWLRQVARSIEYAARMMSAVGTRGFHEYSKILYGTPSEPLDGEVTTLEMAQSIEQILEGFRLSATRLGQEIEYISVEEMAEILRERAAVHFGDLAPTIEIVENIASKAVAGARYIRLRRGERFSDHDAAQLIHHEAYVHIGTTLNGVQQVRMPILAAGHAGTTRTQEGLAVYAELISGSMDPERMKRLSGRTIGISMSMDGAGFMDLYRFFLERTDNPKQAFDHSRRVVRGGLMEGGAPFTKDSTYLDGLLRVADFKRAAVIAGRIDCLYLLYAGKLDLEDIPAMALLAAEGLIEPPRFLPPLIADPRFLVSYLAFTSFINTLNPKHNTDYYIGMIKEAPKTELFYCELPQHYHTKEIA